MEPVNNKFWRLTPAQRSDSAGVVDDPVLRLEDGLAEKIRRRDGIIIALWDADLRHGCVHALGIVQGIDRVRSTAIVDWRSDEFELIPNPQGRSKWADRSYFKFDDAVSRRYGLMDRFRKAFANDARRTPDVQQSQEVSMMSSVEAAVEPPGSLAAPSPGRPGRRVPQCNRVAPDGEIIATLERGTFMGNRADPRRWLVCELEFDRVLKAPRKYTKLFFLDEAVALSAGHRPCKTCRRDRYEAYLAAVRSTVAVTGAVELDVQLNAARGMPYVHAAVRSLPDGAFVSFGTGDYRLVWRGAVHRWTVAGYTEPVLLDDVESDKAMVLTPAPSLTALSNGYPVNVHPSAG